MKPDIKIVGSGPIAIDFAQTFAKKQYPVSWLSLGDQADARENQGQVGNLDSAQITIVESIQDLASKEDKNGFIFLMFETEEQFDIHFQELLSVLKVGDVLINGTYFIHAKYSIYR